MARHLVYCFHDLQHLFITDFPVAIDIVKLESPVQLVPYPTSAGDAQSDDEFLEIYDAVVVCVEYFEDMICEGTWVTKREKLSIDLLELFFR